MTDRAVEFGRRLVVTLSWAPGCWAVELDRERAGGRCVGFALALGPVAILADWFDILFPEPNT